MYWMIEGTWTGYRSSQEQVAHRHYTPRKAEAESIKAIGHGIRFIDGTMLVLDVTECHGRKKLREIKGYKTLIDDCRFNGVSSVAALSEKRKQRNAALASPSVPAVAGDCD